MKAAEAIYITMGAQVIRAMGDYRNMVQQFEKCNGERFVFWWTSANKPKRDFLNVYIVIGNKVRFVAKCVGFEKAGTIDTEDGRTIHAKNWMLLIDFEPMPRPLQQMRGFQGFRYKEF